MSKYPTSIASRMPSAIDQRRLHDGVRALEASARAPETLDEIRRQLDAISAGIAALQSLDDLGSEANERAVRDEQELWKRMRALELRQKQLEGKETTS